MASNKLEVSELDFDLIKSNLKTILQNKSEFQDYNFEGSGFSILLDLLAYNTHYLGLMLICWQTKCTLIVLTSEKILCH